MKPNDKQRENPMMRNTPSGIMAKREQGAVLLVALVLLLIMTLMGVSGMQGAKLQSKMAGNYQDQEIAFQMAELALREAETWIDNLTELPDVTSNPTLPNLANTTGEVWNEDQLDDEIITAGGWVDPNIGAAFWAAQAKSSMVNASIGESSSGAGGYIWTEPRFVVAYIGENTKNQSAGQGQGYGDQSKKIHLYGITAFGVGGRDNTQITLQSVFGRGFSQ